MASRVRFDFATSGGERAGPPIEVGIAPGSRLPTNISLLDAERCADQVTATVVAVREESVTPGARPDLWYRYCAEEGASCHTEESERAVRVILSNDDLFSGWSIAKDVGDVHSLAATVEMQRDEIGVWVAANQGVQIEDFACSLRLRISPADALSAATPDAASWLLRDGCILRSTRSWTMANR